MKTLPSSTIEILLSHGMSTHKLMYSYRTHRCIICSSWADGIYAVDYTCTHEDVEDWTEYVFGCSTCFFSGHGKSLYPEREMPLMGICVHRTYGKKQYIRIPAVAKRHRIYLVLSIYAPEAAPREHTCHVPPEIKCMLCNAAMWPSLIPPHMSSHIT